MLAFLAATLTVYRLTLALYQDAGPFKMLEKWNNWLDGNSYQFNPGPDGVFLRSLRELFECYYCLSFWVALPVALALTFYWQNWLAILTWPALSGGAIVLREVTTNVKE